MNLINKILLFAIISSCNFIAQETTNLSKIEIISPTSNSVLNSSRREGISWISQNTSTIDIQYSIDEFEWKQIFKNIRADLEYIGWNIPSKLSSKKVKLRIIDSHTKYVHDQTKDWIIIQSGQIKSSLNKSGSGETSLKILPLGNSITFDNRSSDIRVVEDKIGYRFPLYQYLNSAGISFDFIGSEHSGSNFLPTGYDENAGFPGIKDHELADLLETGILNMPFYGVTDDTITIGPYLETYTPDIILLHIGTNGNDETGGILANDVEDILNEVDRVEVLLGKSIDVFIARIIDRATRIPEVGQLNNNVQNMIYDRINNTINPAYPDNIQIVDMENGAGLIYSISPDPNGSPGDFNDDLHPNDKGYAKIAGKWYTNINAKLLNFPLNMISYWSLDDILNTISIDRLGTNNLVCTNCPSTTTGMNDNSMVFGSNEQLIATNNFSLNNNLSGNFSVECWVQTTQTGINNKVIIGKYSTSPSWWVGLNSADGLAKFSLRTNSTDGKLVSSNKVINDGYWHHIVCVKDHYNKLIKIYVDGLLENQTPTNFTGNFSESSDLSIGAYINDYYFEGNLDEMTLYDKALNQLEIDANYNKGLRGRDYIDDIPLAVSISMFMEGSYNNGSMTTNLNEQNLLPLKHPFNIAQYSYNGAENVSSIPNQDPSNNIVDWVLISLRSEINKQSEICKRAGFLLSDGRIVDLDGNSPVVFATYEDYYYIVIEHRNHLPIMSNQKIFLSR